MVDFWDTSAIVPLLVDEDHSADVRELLKRHPKQVVAFTTFFECYSALCRLLREEAIDRKGFEESSVVLEMLKESWEVVAPLPALQDEAKRVLRLHPLKSADAVQLASAILVSEREVKYTTFITFDSKLKEAAMNEGFQVVT